MLFMNHQPGWNSAAPFKRVESIVIKDPEYELIREGISGEYTGPEQVPVAKGEVIRPRPSKGQEIQWT